MTESLRGASDATDEVTRLRREVEKERSERTALERRLASLRAEADACFDGTPVISALVDSRRHLRRANRALLDFLGRPAGEILDRRFGDVFRCLHFPHEGAYCGTTEACKDCAVRATLYETIENRATIHNHEVTMAAVVDGRHVTTRLVVSSTPVTVDGEHMALLCIQDVTQRSRLEHELEKTRRMQSLGTLAGSVAHDLNNVLTVVLGNLSLAKVQTAPGDEVRELLDRCEVEVVRAADLSDRLLTFAQGGAPRKADLDVGAVADEAIDQALRHTTTRCRLSVSPTLPPLQADPDQVALALRHILTNASQALDGGGYVDLTVEAVSLEPGEVASLPAGPYVRLRVHDDGPGIPVADLDRVTDPFFTTRPGATGLGLTVAYSIAARHDGKLLLSSPPGGGTSVDLLLPALAETAEAPVARPKAPVAALAPAPSGRRRLLIMDDEDTLLEATSAMLSFVGWDVTTSHDGTEMLARYTAAKVADEPFDVVIMDLTVPKGMGGREAIRRLIELDPTARAIVSSGYATDPIMARFWEYGFTDCLPKPYGMRELEDVVARVAEGRTVTPS